MAKTVDTTLEKRNEGGLLALPVASGQTIYQNTIAVVAGGYLKNLVAGVVDNAELVGIVADGSANTTGPAATTANGSISGTTEVASVPAGDKTVRQVWTKGRFLLTGSGFAQTSVGKIAYATDNFTIGLAGADGVPIGTIVSYISATQVWVELNVFKNVSGTSVIRGAVTNSDANAGGAFSVANPTGDTLLIERLMIDVTTAATAAITIDAGVATNGTTTSDTLIDGGALDAINILDNTVNGGTNGRGFRKWTSSQYVTGDLSATNATLVATYAIFYRPWA